MSLYQVPEKYWNSPEPHGKFVGLSYFEEGPVDKPTLIEEDLSERVKHFSERGFVWNLWSKLIRREFLTENKIRFANNLVQDMLATCCFIFILKRTQKVIPKNKPINKYIKVIIVITFSFIVTEFFWQFE